MYTVSKKPLSVTLEVDNLRWLRGRTGAAGLRSVSELIDRLVTEARVSGHGPVRSVVGTVDIDSSDPRLEAADSAVRSLFEASLIRPVVAKETTTGYGARGRAPKKRRR
jgi:hypothetical protein